MSNKQPWQPTTNEEVVEQMWLELEYVFSAIDDGADLPYLRKAIEIAEKQLLGEDEK